MHKKRIKINVNLKKHSQYSVLLTVNEDHKHNSLDEVDSVLSFAILNYYRLKTVKVWNKNE